jgi:DHA3 family macrolide efflux protein-like MFS transporter
VSGDARGLFNRDFLLLWQGQAISQLGNQAFVVAMMFWTMEATGSASLMGLLMSLALLPGVLLSPFGGTFADRHSRVRILVICDLASGLAIAALAALFYMGASTATAVTGLFAAAVFAGIVRSFFQPAIAAALPDLVPAPRLMAANSLNQLSIQVSQLLGQAAGGLLFRAIGAPLLFVLDALSFFYAGACAALIRAAPPAPRPAPEGGPLRAFLRETGAGLRFTWSREGLRNVMLIAALINFFVAPFYVLLPFYVQLYLKAGAAWYGFLLAALSAGSVAGFLLAGALKPGPTARGRLLLAGLVVGPILLGALGFATAEPLALLMTFGGGLAFGVVNIYLITLIQLSTPAELRGRVLGLLTTLATGLLPLGMALAGVLGDLTGKNVPLIFGASGALSAILTLALATRPACRAFFATPAPSAGPSHHVQPKSRSRYS